jgi:hypothetical protein
MQPNLVSRVATSQDSHSLLGLAALAKRAFLGINLRPLREHLTQHISRLPHDANALMDLSILLHLAGNREAALTMQARAIAQQQTFHLPSSITPTAVRLLAIMTSGDLTQNNAVEFLVESSDVALDILYVAPGLPLPAIVPDHDVAMVAICESDRNRPVLKELEASLRQWQRTVLNVPERIARLSRNGACDLIRSEPGLCLPRTVRVNRAILRSVAEEEINLPQVLEDAEFPLIVRPVDSHKGQGQAKLQSPAELRDYLHSRAEEDFYLTRFVDYRSPDGQFRKYRIVLIGGRPELCHLAISEHWMVHYMSAGMTENAGKRAEEARVMRDFDRDFVQRHGKALATVARNLELEYVGIDCGETDDGELLIFEVDSGMTVHSMDPPDLFPYKGPQMRKVFDAFRALLINAARRGSSVTAAA